MAELGFEGMLAGPRAWILYSLTLLCLEVWQDSNWDKFSLWMDSLERRLFPSCFQSAGEYRREMHYSPAQSGWWYSGGMGSLSPNMIKGEWGNACGGERKWNKKKETVNNWMIDCIYPVLPSWRYENEDCDWNCLSFPCPWMVFWSASRYWLTMVGSAFCRGHVIL